MKRNLICAALACAGLAVTSTAALSGEVTVRGSEFVEKKDCQGKSCGNSGEQSKPSSIASKSNNTQHAAQKNEGIIFGIGGHGVKADGCKPPAGSASKAGRNGSGDHSAKCSADFGHSRHNDAF